MANVAEVEFLDKVVKYYTPNNITEWRARSIYEKEPITIEWIKSVNPGEIVFDVGANVGMYSMLLAARGAEVYAFEPEALNYACLCTNIKLNNFSHVYAYCMGILDEPGFTTLNSTKEDVAVGDSMYTVGEDINFDLSPAKIGYRQGVAVTTLDSFCEITELVPNHIKIDVDGLDYKVVNGNLKTLEKATTAIIELNPNWKEHQEAIDNMKSLGFNLDQDQVDAATRKNNAFEGLAEHLFYK